MWTKRENVLRNKHLVTGDIAPLVECSVSMPKTPSSIPRTL